MINNIGSLLIKILIILNRSSMNFKIRYRNKSMEKKAIPNNHLKSNPINGIEGK